MKKYLSLILIIPLFAGAQMPAGHNTTQWLNIYIQNNQHHHFENKSGGLRDDTSFLSATRTDTFDIANNVFNQTDSSQYLYNVDSTLNALVRLVNDPDTGWINYLADYYSYDSQKNDTLDLLDGWDYIQGIWSNEARNLKVYDASHHLLSATSYTWDTITPWKAFFQEAYEYDSAYNLLQLVYLSTGDGTNWDSSAKFVYTYDSSNNRITETDYSYSGAVILPQNLSTATYNADNYEIQNIIQYWGGSSWKNLYQDTLSYDASNNLIVFERREWHSGSYSWTYAKTEFTYNGLNQLITRTDYDGDQVTYLLTYQNSYAYNADGYLSYNLQQRYDALTAVFQNVQQTFYYYVTLISGVEITDADQPIMRLFPNPATQQVQVSIHAEQSPSINIQVMDLNGRMVLSQSSMQHEGDNLFTINVSSLPAGYYTLRIINSTNGPGLTSRFIKE